MTFATDADQIPELAERGRERAHNFHSDLNQRLESIDYVAGNFLSVADITA